MSISLPSTEIPSRPCSLGPALLPRHTRLAHGLTYQSSPKIRSPAKVIFEQRYKLVFALEKTHAHIHTYTEAAPAGITIVKVIVYYGLKRQKSIRHRKSSYAEVCICGPLWG